jgi:hypothetical protein
MAFWLGQSFFCGALADDGYVKAVVAVPIRKGSAAQHVHAHDVEIFRRDDVVAGG